MITRFLREYRGTDWETWLLVFCVLSVPFFLERLRRFPVIGLQAFAWSVTFVLPSMFQGTVHGMTGNDAMGLASAVGFGIGYALLAIRHREGTERVLGWCRLYVLVSLVIRMALVQMWRS